MSAPSQQYIQQQMVITDGILSRLRIYSDLPRVRNQIFEVIRRIPSLQPRMGANGGKQMFYLTGTIPITYNRAQYNIPVSVWLPETFPKYPPKCFVNPVQGMIIKPKHRHVDSNGIVYHPYLSQWNLKSNLIGVISAMGHVFSEDPPVRSQPQSQPPPQQQSRPAPQPQPQPQYPYGAQSQPSASIPPPRQSFPPGTPFEDPAVVMKRNAIGNLTQKIQAQLHSYYSSTTKGIDQEMQKTSQIENQNHRLNFEIEQAERELTQLDGDIEGLTKSFEDLSSWLDKHDKDDEVDIDQVTEPKDPLSKQLLNLVAEDAAIEDTLYYLEKKLINGELEIDVFLKNVRSLSNEQFIKRATIRKIHERQRASRR